MKASVSLKLFLLMLGLATTGVQGAEYDIEPYPAPITCKGEFRCVGDTYPKGKVSANHAYWNEKDCVADLKAQVAGQCAGTKVELVNVRIYNKNQGSTVVSCSANDFYFPYGAVSGGSAGFGSFSGRTAAEAGTGAYNACRKHGANHCQQTVVSPRNGCVGYFWSRPRWRDYFYTGCTSTEVRKAARAGCGIAYCEEIEIRCAH